MPSVYLHIGTIVGDENKIRMLVDTNTTMNTGNKAYHQWTMPRCPNMITEYLKCGADTEYDVAQFFVALDLKETPQHVTHDSMTSVLRYRTPYFSLIPFLFLFFL